MLALTMIVIASWVLYRYLAPEGLKEWRNAGLIQAFIIALYAEMYGFPLTIYFLTSFLGLNIPWLHMRGHLWATLLGYGDFGALIEMIIGFLIIGFGLLLIYNGWRKIYRVRHEHQLVTDGIYQYMRHPQYTGLFLVIFGQLIHWPTIPTLVLFPFIVAAYVHLAVKEEREMEQVFEKKYAVYRSTVPMFIPHITNLKKLLREV